MFRSEVASLNMGSMNFGLFPMLERFKNFAYAWSGHILKDPEIAFSEIHLQTSRRY